MKELTNIEQSLLEIERNNFLILYIWSDTCSVCKGIEIKLNEMLQKYPKIKCFSINAYKVLDVAGKFSIYTTPMILFFIDGKEIIRESKFVNMTNLNKRINRYYNIYFNN